MFTEELNKYLIPGALDFINKWCKDYPITLIIKDARITKLGDYRKDGNRHKITLNYGLDKELSFHILTHEIAHMHVREKYGRSIKPHGIEWKNAFTTLILESLHLFEPKLQQILFEFAKNPRAGFYSYAPLTQYFQLKENPEKLFLKDLPKDAVFKSSGRIFKKGNKRKIRYICTDLSTGKKYSIHPLAPIDGVIEEGI